MDAEKETALIQEFISDFQIPPYADPASIERYAKEGEAYFRALVPSADFETDGIARMLLKNYMYYAYNHAVPDFYANYERAILSWQMHAPVEEDDA